MQIITIESQAFQEIKSKLESIYEKLTTQRGKAPLKETWFDNQEVCQLLHISTRTLQHYRDDDLLPYSQIGAKIYYKASDIDNFLLMNYKKK